MSCKFCGAALNNGETSCPYCGNKNVRQDVPPPAPNVAEPANDELNPEFHRSAGFDDGLTSEQREAEQKDREKEERNAFFCCALPALILIIAFVIIVLFT